MQDSQLEPSWKQESCGSLDPICPQASRSGRVVQEDDGYEEAVREHNVFGIWLDKDGVPNTQQPETRMCGKDTWGVDN